MLRWSRRSAVRGARGAVTARLAVPALRDVLAERRVGAALELMDGGSVEVTGSADVRVLRFLGWRERPDADAPAAGGTLRRLAPRRERVVALDMTDGRIEERRLW